MLVKLGDRFGIKIGYEQRFPLGKGRPSYGATDIESRWSLSRRTDLRLYYGHNGAEVLNIGFGTYW